MKRLQTKGNTPVGQIARLLKDIEENKPHAVDRFLTTIQETVFAFGMKVCGGQIEDTEDTMQEVLIRFFQGARKFKFKDPRALTVWLYKVAKNACLMSRRKGMYEPKDMLSLNSLLPKKESERVRLLEVPHWSRAPDEILLNRENRYIIEKALLDLPLEYRLVLVLRDMEDLSTKEVSNVLGISEANVKVRLHRGRLFIRNALSKNFAVTYGKGERFE
jgi:RNA polymerase sigma-70 factor, ECF subfamily